jgi:fibrillarin-like pre-rRNA processing protein
VLGDARNAEEYSDLVPPVDGVYADIAQPDQIEILRTNASIYLQTKGRPVLLALKASSMGRERSPAGHLAAAEVSLDEWLERDPSVRLDPVHRAHYFLGGRAGPELFPTPSAISSRYGHRRAGRAP